MLVDICYKRFDLDAHQNDTFLMSRCMSHFCRGLAPYLCLKKNGLSLIVMMHHSMQLYPNERNDNLYDIYPPLPGFELRTIRSQDRWLTNEPNCLLKLKKCFQFEKKENLIREKSGYWCRSFQITTFPHAHLINFLSYFPFSFYTFFSSSFPFSFYTFFFFFFFFFFLYFLFCLLILLFFFFYIFFSFLSYFVFQCSFLVSLYLFLLLFFVNLLYLSLFCLFIVVL